MSHKPCERQSSVPKSTAASRSGRDPAFLQVYRMLYRHFGPQHWWPGDTPMEICVGAILTQNTAWTNVEKAIRNLKQADVCTVDALLAIRESKLAGLIRPSGYFNVKARRLKHFLAFLKKTCRGDLASAFAGPLMQKRNDLLAIHGIGPETADSILLYAAERRIFVVDAYTKRIFSRLGLLPPDASYDAMRLRFERSLPRSIRLYKEYHALIVALGKDICRPSPRCPVCPLQHICPEPGKHPQSRQASPQNRHEAIRRR